MSEFLIRNAWLVPFFPLLGGLIAAVAGRRLGGYAHVPVVVGIGLAFLVSLGLLTVAGRRPPRSSRAGSTSASCVSRSNSGSTA